jgi:hypothetical protein
MCLIIIVVFNQYCLWVLMMDMISSNYNMNIKKADLLQSNPRLNVRNRNYLASKFTFLENFCITSFSFHVLWSVSYWNYCKVEYLIQAQFEKILNECFVKVFYVIVNLIWYFAIISSSMSYICEFCLSNNYSVFQTNIVFF